MVSENSGYLVRHQVVPDSYITQYPSFKSFKLRNRKVILPGGDINNPEILDVDATVVSVTDAFQVGGRIYPGVLALVKKGDLSNIKFRIKEGGKIKTVSYADMRNVIDLGIMDTDAADPGQLQIYKDIYYGDVAATKEVNLSGFVLVPFIINDNLFQQDAAIEKGNMNLLYSK